MENAEILSSAAGLYNKGKVVNRKEADHIIHENIKSIDLGFFLQKDFSCINRGEKMAVFVALGLHPEANHKTLEFLLNKIPEALEESSAFSYRLLSAIKRLLIRGIWSDLILEHQKSLSLFPEIGNKDVQVAARAVIRLIELHNSPDSAGTVDSKSKSTHKIINEIKTASSEIKKTIEREHNETRIKIDMPVVDHNYLTNWKCRLLLESREVIINKGKKDISFQLTNLQLEIVTLLIKNSLSKDYSGEFMHWEDIIPKIPRWRRKNDMAGNDDSPIAEYEVYRNIKKIGQSCQNNRDQTPVRLQNLHQSFKHYHGIT